MSLDRAKLTVIEYQQGQKSIYMLQRAHPLKRLRKMIYNKLNSRNRVHAKVSPQFMDFLKTRGSEMITMTTL